MNPLATSEPLGGCLAGRDLVFRDLVFIEAIPMTHSRDRDSVSCNAELHTVVPSAHPKLPGERSPQRPGAAYVWPSRQPCEHTVHPVVDCGGERVDFSRRPLGQNDPRAEDSRDMPSESTRRCPAN